MTNKLSCITCGSDKTTKPIQSLYIPVLKRLQISGRVYVILLLASFLLLLASCQQRSKPSAQSTLTEMGVHKKTEHEQLLEQFKMWRQHQIQTGKLLEECPSLETALENIENGVTRLGGIGNFRAEFGDFNSDGKMDGLFAIYPYDCAQTREPGMGEEFELPILITWKQNGYKFDSVKLEDIRQKIKNQLRNHTDWVDVYFTDLEDGEVKGTYRGHLPNDPGIWTSMSGDFTYTTLLSGSDSIIFSNQEIQNIKEEPKGMMSSEKLSEKTKRLLE